MTSETFFSGDWVLIDRVVRAEFVRHVDDFNAVVRLGVDTRIVALTSLSTREA